MLTDNDRAERSTELLQSRSQDPSIQAIDLASLPANWELLRLRRVATFRPSPNEMCGVSATDEVTFLPMEAISDRGKIDRSSTRPVADIINGYSYFREGDVLRAKVTPCFENGKGAIATGLTRGYGFGTTELFVIRPGPRLDARFLYYLTNSDRFTKIGASTIYGAHGVKRVDDAFVRNFAFGLPPLPEQRAIAAFLDRETARIDDLVAKRGEMIAMLGARRCALLEQTIRGEAKSGVPAVETGNRWIPQLPSDWLLIRARHVIDYISSGSRGWGDYYADEGAVFIRSADLQRNSVEIHLSDAAHVILPREAEGVRTRVRQHDVLVGITGANVGYVGYIRDPVGEAYVSQHVALVRPRPDVYGEWLAYALSTPSVAAQLVAEQYGGTKQQLSLENISNLWLALPPQLIQASIARRIGKGIGRTALIVASLERSMKRLLERRQALITAAVTGRIDVA